mmetsp:Transcript_14433/g.36216  ORF Transcript_14433/g.36216 Transcript_14433/m.36216 type:complete len:86 (-) Transcript_14433:96-353(-)
MAASAASEGDPLAPSVDTMLRLASVPYPRERAGRVSDALAAADGRAGGAGEKAEQDGAAARRQRSAECAACLLRLQREGGTLLWS